MMRSLYEMMNVTEAYRTNPLKDALCKTVAEYFTPQIKAHYEKSEQEDVRKQVGDRFVKFSIKFKNIVARSYGATFTIYVFWDYLMVTKSERTRGNTTDDGNTYAECEVDTDNATIRFGHSQWGDESRVFG